METPLQLRSGRSTHHTMLSDQIELMVNYPVRSITYRITIDLAMSSIACIHFREVNYCFVYKHVSKLSHLSFVQIQAMQEFNLWPREIKKDPFSLSDLVDRDPSGFRLLRPTLRGPHIARSRGGEVLKSVWPFVSTDVVSLGPHGNLMEDQ